MKQRKNISHAKFVSRHILKINMIGVNSMLYLSIFTMAFIVSFIIKMYLYPNKNREGLLKWISALYIKEKFVLLIDIFLVTAYLLLYKKYSFSFLFFSYMILISILLITSIVDLKTKIIPDKLIILGIALGILMMFLNHGLSIISPLLGFVISGGIIAVISIITKGAIGIGDAKLFACIGIFLGLQSTLGIMMLSTIISGLTGLILLTFKIANRKTTLPFAPFILAATIFVIVVNL